MNKGDMLTKIKRFGFVPVIAIVLGITLIGLSGIDPGPALGWPGEPTPDEVIVRTPAAPPATPTTEPVSPDGLLLTTTEVIVDDLDSGFARYGPSGGWYHSGSGDTTYNAHAYWTYCTDTWQGPSVNNWAIWTPNLPSSGQWEVFAYIPWVYTGRYDTGRARYQIHTASGDYIVERDQNNYTGWVSLGTYTFNTGTSGYVRLEDVTPDWYFIYGGQWYRKTIKFDAIKWVLRGIQRIYVPQTGTVRVSWVSSSANCPGSEFGLMTPGNLVIFTNYTTSQPPVDIGYFQQGTEIAFYIVPGGYCGSARYQSTDPNHARITQVNATTYRIAWEDSTDRDFNDLVVDVTVTQPPACPGGSVDVVFAMDTSGSMNDEFDSLCSKISQVVTALQNRGVNVTYRVLGIARDRNCTTGSVASLFPGRVNHEEDWGPAVYELARRYNWRSGATRLIIPMADEGPQDGCPCNDPGDDRDSITDAIAAARAHGVVVSPVIGTNDPGQCDTANAARVWTLANDLANGTGGRAFRTADFPERVIQALFDLIGSASCQPSISGVNPSCGSAGTQVTIQGNNFASGATVDLCQGSTCHRAQVTSLTTTQIVFTVPFGLTTGIYDIVVTNPGGYRAIWGGQFKVPCDDTTPPSIYNIIESNDPICKQGTGSPDTVTISAQVTDPSGVAWAKLYYRLNYGSWNNVTMGRSDSTYSATIGPFSETGTVEYYIKARDNVGNERDSPTYTVTVQNCDITPPYIFNVVESNDPICKQGTGSPDTVNIAAQVTDPSGVAWAKLYYRLNYGSWNNVIMGHSDSTYSATIGPFSETGTVEYYIKARDNAGNERDSPIYTITVQDCFDLKIDSVVPVQVLEGQSLVVGKATAVKVIVSKTGNKGVNDVRVKLMSGAEELTSFYVSEPDNWDTQFKLHQDNAAYPLSFSSTETSKTIYFFGDDLAPTASGIYGGDVLVWVDYPNLISETDETNNLSLLTELLEAYEAKWGIWPFSALRLRHVPVEQWRSSEVVNYAKTQTDFIEATYPVAASNLQEGVGVIPFIRSCPMSNEFCLKTSFLELWAEGKLIDPTADRIIGIAPTGWLHDNYPSILGPGVKGVSLGSSVHSVFVEMESGIGTTAHEVGHTYGLWTGKCPSGSPLEEYDQNCDGILEPGNAVQDGLHVASRTVMNDGNMKDGTRHRVYCFMGTVDYNPPTLDRFVDAGCYQDLAMQSGRTARKQVLSKAEMAEEGIVLVMGFIGKDGSAELLDWYRLPEGAPDELEPGSYILQALDGEGWILYEKPFTMTFSLMGSMVPGLEEAPFAFSVPFIPGTAQFVLQHNERTLASKNVSAHSPSVTVLTPNGGEKLSGSSTVEWIAEDADGDALTYVIFLSSDNGATWSTLAMDVTTTTYALDVSAIPAGTSNLIKVMATDGVNTGQDLSDAPFTIIGKSYLPLILKNHP